MEENNSRKKLYILGPLILLIGLVGVGYAIFNYTRTGTANVIKVGKISFNSNQTETINLTNVFPIDSANVDTDTTNVDEALITITGDTTYPNGIEYLLAATDVSNTVGTGNNQKTVPISIALTATNGLGTADADYFTNRGSSSSVYKVLASDGITEDEELVVGYIAAGQTGVSGSVTIKAYLDKDKIGISDTYDGTESDNMGTTNEWANGRTILTTTEWNALQTNGVSFKVKVEANEGIWVEEPPTLYSQIIQSVKPITLINFANNSSSSNGEGLYVLTGTEHDTYPIYYYRGDVDDNNVIFGGFCWQIVRTTDTGGIKMIYNGETTDNGTTCINSTHDTRVIDDSNSFNINSQSMSDVGYMSNKRYPYKSVVADTGSVFGKDIEWHNDHYLVIENTSNTASTNTTEDKDHHYSCGTVTNNIPDTECSIVRFYYYKDQYYNNYIELENGELLEDALYKMTGNGTTQVKNKLINQNYKLNENDSTIKTNVENWFKINLTNELDANNINYQNYIEDTVYCNDRSFKSVNVDPGYSIYQDSGWNPNGGILDNKLYYGAYNRYYNNWYSTSNIPSLDCPNETDQFKVSNELAKLKYPVGLLTNDEGVLAGASGTTSTANNSYYLYTGGNYYLLTPASVSYNMQYMLSLSSNGSISNSTVYFPSGKRIRPVISLKHNTEYEDGGEGTPTNPYVVKYN